MRKSFFISLLILLLLSGNALSENLILNPDFSLNTADGDPLHWYQDSWNKANTKYSIEILPNGEKAAFIHNFLDNDARWVQEIEVAENSYYKISCRVKAEGISENGLGATLSVITNASVHSPAVYDTEGEWELLELFGRTGKGQKRMLVAGRVGGYSAVSTGKAWFTDFSIEMLEMLPKGVYPENFDDIENVSFESYASAPSSAPKRITETLILLAFVSFLFMVALYQQSLRSPVPDIIEPRKNREASILGLLCLLTVGFFVRAYIALTIRGYYVDVTNFLGWGESFLTSGVGFYSLPGLHDYPPAYMVILAIESALRRLLQIPYNSPAHILIIKLAPIFADLIFAAIAFRLFEKKCGGKRALILASFILFNPAFITDSAAWGQVDSVLTLLIVITVLYAVDGKWLMALPVYALSILTKPQALLFGPIGFTALAADAYMNRKNKGHLKYIAVSLAASLCVLYVGCAPFAIHDALAAGDKNVISLIISPVRWMVSLYTSTASGYRYITVNALNLYALLGQNWIDMASVPTLAQISWFLFALSLLIPSFFLFVSKSRRALPLAGAVAISLIFCFAPMMHERYLFPAIALLVLSYIEYKDKRLLYVLFIFTLTQFLNQAMVLQCGMVDEYSYMGHLSSEEDFLNIPLAAANLIASVYLTYVSASILVKKEIYTLPKPKPGNSHLVRLPEAPNYRLRLSIRDYLLMAAVTVLYSLIAFTNLGTLQAPETYWKNTEFHENVVFDLGETKTFRMTYYGGISASTFTVALSNDGENWTEENYAVYGEGEIFRWHWYSPKARPNGSDFVNAVYDPATANDMPSGGASVSYPTFSDPYPLQTARYVRLTVNGIGLPLHEVGFWDIESETLIEVINVYGSEDGAEYSNLIDEQDTVAFTPSYYNGTYFDEIYHARTAYEFINELSVLEWSHPHLGKILIMAGISIFGMNPFGWRFMGTLFGVMMLPLMYLVIKQLTKKTNLSFVGMFLLAVDSMHFTQTRIATVDSFAVFFIMLMYLFMFRYYQMNLNRDKFSSTLIPLGLSGVSMGLACASKWIGMYAGVGLAVIFFISIYQRIKEYISIRRNIQATGFRKADPSQIEICRAFPKRIVYTLLFCVLMFVIVPIIIYYLCYYWHFAPTGEFNIKKVWDMQLQMFNYHAGLSGDTHSFRSPWYEWPLVVRPMWYYSASTAETGKGIVSSISCMGNPIVWWFGAISMVIMLVLLVFEKRTNHAYLLIAIGFASQFLPWVLVPRSTFIYHYFASVPFIIVASVLMLEKLSSIDRYASSIASITIMALALILFVMFYPLESGYPCSYDYALHLRWFNWYNFALQ